MPYLLGTTLGLIGHHPGRNYKERLVNTMKTKRSLYLRPEGYTGVPHLIKPVQPATCAATNRANKRKNK